MDKSFFPPFFFCLTTEIFPVSCGAVRRQTLPSSVCQARRRLALGPLAFSLHNNPPQHLNMVWLCCASLPPSVSLSLPLHRFSVKHLMFVFFNLHTNISSPSRITFKWHENVFQLRQIFIRLRGCVSWVSRVSVLIGQTERRVKWKVTVQWWRSHVVHVFGLLISALCQTPLTQAYTISECAAKTHTHTHSCTHSAATFAQDFSHPPHFGKWRATFGQSWNK